MKKFILHILLFFAILAVIDVAAGKVFWYLQSTRAGGRTGAEYYACKESNDDVIIMGSSRASHHYIPQIISDSLGLSCFNAGQDGNGIVLQYGRWKMLTERHSPKVLIYDVNIVFDLCQNDNMTYVDRLKPFCNDNTVRNYVSEIFPMERVKLLSQMYRYNYKFLEILFDCTRSCDINNGYEPLFGEIRQEIVDDADAVMEEREIVVDKIKIHYLEKLIKECKENGTILFFVASPAFRGSIYGEKSFSAVKELSTKYDVPFYYYYKSRYSENPLIFKDSQHLNDQGATLFTSDIVSQIHL